MEPYAKPWLCRGPRHLDQCFNLLLEHPDQAPETAEEAALPMLDLLLRRLCDAAADLRVEGNADVAAALGSGLAKLLMQQLLQQDGAPVRIGNCDVSKVGHFASIV